MMVLISAYLFVIFNGKKFMEHRKPFEIKWIIVTYNILQILANIVIFALVSSTSDLYSSA